MLIYQLKEQNGASFYYLSKRHVGEVMVLNTPAKVKDWKEKNFFVNRLNWEFEQSGSEETRLVTVRRK